MNSVPLLFRSNQFIAVDKPAGISVHNVEDSTNLIQLLLKQLKLKTLFPVHRLDKETSGVQLLAFDAKSAQTLATQFQERSVNKFYSGIVRGRIAVTEGSWSFPLTDKGEGRNNPAGAGKARVACETKFRVVEASDYFTRCEFQLLTGRQHQIRKHTAIVKHGLVGDPRYGDPGYNQKIAKLHGTERMLLHSSRIEISGQIIECPAPSEFGLFFAKN